MYLQHGRSADGLALLIEAHQYFEQQGNKLWTASTLSAMAGAFGDDVGDEKGKAKAIDYSMRALALMDGKRSRYDMSTLLHNLGVDHAGLTTTSRVAYNYTPCKARLQRIADRVAASAFASVLQR